jgi:hypothetical protein
MKSLAIVFFAAAAASPFVYWFFIRRSDSRAEREREERTPALDKIISDPGRTTRFEVEARPDRPLLQQQEVEKAGDISGESKRSHTSRPEPIACLCTEPELENLTHPEVEALAVLGGIGEPAPTAVLERADQLPLAERSHASELEPTAHLRTESEQEDSSYPQVETLAVYGGIGEPAPDTVLERTDQLPFAEIGQSASVSLTQPIQEQGNAATVLELSDISASGSTQVIEADLIAEVAAADPDLQGDGPLAASAETSIPFHTEQLPQPKVGSGDGGLAEPGEDFDGGAQEALSRYRPPVQKPPRSRDKQVEKPESNRAAAAEAVSSIRVRLTFDRLGFCTFSLLPERTSGLDDEVLVSRGGRETRLLGQEVWYEDLPFSEAGAELRTGIELRGKLADGRRGRWLLTGRDLYVLASHPSATGFVSTDRLALGRAHIVLCVTEIIETVEAILNEAGCSGYTKIDETYGVPSGWVALRHVSPTEAIPLDPGIDDFYAIKPAPDIEIELEGGLRLRNSVWIAGYPPRIKLLGECNVPVKVLIDGKEGQGCADRSFAADGFDLIGDHFVYCEGLSCSASYSIEEPLESWEPWAAHCYGGGEICGPLVQESPENAERRIVTVPMSNPVLLGASPGMIFYCSRRSAARWKGYAPFDPVWALPAHPLTSNKNEARIIQLADIPVISVHGRYANAALNWSNAILDASRKGLRIANESIQSKESWSTYKKVARSIWRATR